MLARYAEIKEDLAAACEDEDDLTPPLYDPLFAKKASCHMKMLKVINTVTVELKKRALTLHEGRCIENSLIESVGKGKIIGHRPCLQVSSRVSTYLHR